MDGNKQGDFRADQTDCEFSVFIGLGLGYSFHSVLVGQKDGAPFRQAFDCEFLLLGTSDSCRRGMEFRQSLMKNTGSVRWFASPLCTGSRGMCVELRAKLGPINYVFCISWTDAVDLYPYSSPSPEWDAFGWNDRIPKIYQMKEDHANIFRLYELEIIPKLKTNFKLINVSTALAASPVTTLAIVSGYLQSGYLTVISGDQVLAHVFRTAGPHNRAAWDDASITDVMKKVTGNKHCRVINLIGRDTDQKINFRGKICSLSDLILMDGEEVPESHHLDRKLTWK
jgi:hypothetical protein